MQNLKRKESVFCNEVVNKRKLQDLMYLTFQNYGVIKSSLIADKLKNLTFHYATQSGISLNTEDLKVPYRKRSLIGLTSNEIETTEHKYEIGTITSVERFQKVIDIWNNASNTLKDDVLTYFRESDPLNPLYIMAFSGARGNISQVRQLVGMRGLMADPQGQIIDLPIKSNFREGLNVTEYIISSYGARKGLVDTALRTADSGYLTRRLVDVAQDIIVREEDCFTDEGLSYQEFSERYETEASLKKRLVGRLLLDDIYDEKQKLIGRKNEEISLNLVKDLEKHNINDFKFRSPLTCNSNRSVCRKCYGWHLAYSQLIDLGEAVGIIAAQSIGEPGTQLTMRTFHTGGVFSGDLTRQIRSPLSGTVFYELSSNTILVRTMHGEKGFKLLENVNIFIKDKKQAIVSLDIPKGNILLVNNRQKIYSGQIIAEIKKDANLILEEDSKNIYTETSGEIFFQNIQTDIVIDKQGTSNETSKNPGLIWVLNGEQYTLPISTEIKVAKGDKILPDTIVASQQLTNKYAGIFDFDLTKKSQKPKVLTSVTMFQSTELKKDSKGDLILKIKNANPNKTFLLTVKQNEILEEGQTIAVLKENRYKTETGGIVYYDLEPPTYNKKNRVVKKVFSGFLYWVPEETHMYKVSIRDDIKIKHNTFIEKGAEIWSGNYSKVGGLFQIDDLNQILTIKPGELFYIDDLQKKKISQANKFIKAGEILLDNIIVQRLSYLEIVEINELSYIFLRPVLTYEVPREKGFSLEHLFFPSVNNRKTKIRTVKKIFFKHGEHYKSNTGTNLTQTFLVINSDYKDSNLRPQFKYTQTTQRNKFKFQITVPEDLPITESSPKTFKESISTAVSYPLLTNQFVYPKTCLVKIQIIAKGLSTFLGVKTGEAKKDILLLKDNDIKTISYDKKDSTLKVKMGDLVRVGTLITNTLRSPYSGQIYAIKDDCILIRIGKPSLISKGTILRIKNKDLVKRSDLLATLVYEKLKTVDIVQGLPKVEEILEARKVKNGCLLAPCPGQVYLKNSRIEILNINGSNRTINIEPKIKPCFSNGSFVRVADPLTDGPINPHEMLETLFGYYQENFNVAEACKLSFKKLQLFLIYEIQRTYGAQNVQIADKHIEVIVKQMTSRVKIEENGSTTLLPGEILKLNQALALTKVAESLDNQPPFYIPILLGLTKASLNSDSFISAASFQETTRVLTEAALEGKKDWLNGLKENVIIGRLIPAGTGFNASENLNRLQKENYDKKLFNKKSSETTQKHILNYRLNK